MMRKLLLLLAVPLTVALSASPAYALIDHDALKQAACSGIDLGTGNACDDDANQNTISRLLSTTLNILSLVVGVAAVIMIIVAGLKYVTSGGESTATASAKNTLIYALVGLVIVVLAQAIVHFVLNKIG